jgi:rSAM/selenodomain-associated transferase 1
MTNSTNTILLFTRYPRSGKCKTRLIPEYSADEAADIHRQLVSHSHKTITSYLTLHNNAAYHICYTGASVKEMRDWLGQQKFLNQQGGNLGKRMAKALKTALHSSDKCLLMGADCPGITEKLLQNGFTVLQEKDIVLGPAHDGGYYLVGVNNTLTPEQIDYLFTAIPWGGEKVLAKTIERINKLQLTFQLLEKLHDIDTADDLQYFNHYSHTE